MANSIIVELDLDDLAAQAKLRGFTQKAKKKGSEAGAVFASGFTKNVKANISASVKAFGAILAASIGFRAIANNITQATAALRGFSRAVANVNSILPKNNKLTRESIDTFKDYAGLFGTSSARQADAFYSIVSAGIKGTAKQLRVLKTSNEAAIAGLVDIDTSAKLIVSSMNSYAKSGLTAAKASDILFVAVREGQTTFGELAASLGNVAPVASAAGLKFEELAGAIAGITKAGIKTDIAVTGVRALLASLIKVTPEAAKEAKRLGLAFSTSALKSKGLVTFLKDLAVATKGNEVALGKLFPNVRALTPILQVVNGDFQDFTRIQREVANALGATSDAAAEVKKSLDFKLQQATANFALLSQEIINNFIPALGEAAGALSRWFILNRDSASVTSKLQATITNLTKELDYWNGIMAKQGVLALKQWSSNATGAQRSAFALSEKIKELQNSMLDISNQKLLNESVFGKITIAKAELFELENQLKNVGNAFVNIEGKSDIELLGNITAKKDEIAALNDELIRTTTIAPKMVDTSTTISASFKKIEAAGKRMATIFNNSVTKGISGGIQTIITSIGKGQDAFANFGKFFLQVIGDMAIKMGETLILTGIGIESLKALGGSAAIAAGAGLVALGTIIKNSAGGGSDTSGNGGGGFNGGIAKSTEALDDPEKFNDRQTSTEININVEGSLVQQEELGLFIQDTLNEVNEKNGIIQVNTRVA